MSAIRNDAAATLPTPPRNNLIQDTTVDTLGHKGGESKDADTGLSMILDCCSDAVMYEAAKMQAEGGL